MSCSARLPVYVLLIGAFLTDGYPWWVPGLVMFSMYLLGLVLAPLVAFVLKKTLLRGATPVFVMEMPSYKWPSLRTVLRRMFDAAGSFLTRAGTVILATTILVWVLLSFPRGNYPERIEGLKAAGEAVEALDRKAEDGEELDEEEAAAFAQLKQDRARVEALQAKRDEGEFTEEDEEEWRELRAKVEPFAEANALEAEWKRQSWLGRTGRAIEPAVRPLGWDWRIGVAALASFPAREVVVGVLGVLYQEGKVDSKDEAAAKKLGEKMRPQYSLATALSLMVFFALCCQCASTLAVIRRETRSWRWPAFTFAYMTALAYVAALAVYQVGSLFA
jgi:ferrous iron transport protein B